MLSKPFLPKGSLFGDAQICRTPSLSITDGVTATVTHLSPPQLNSYVTEAQKNNVISQGHTFWSGDRTQFLRVSYSFIYYGLVFFSNILLRKMSDTQQSLKNFTNQDTFTHHLNYAINNMCFITYLSIQSPINPFFKCNKVTVISILQILLQKHIINY